MENLTANQVALIGTAALMIGGLIGWIGRGVSFLMARWWTGAPKHEKASYLNAVADLGAKLRAHGMTMEEVRSLETMVQNPSVSTSDAASHVLKQMVEDASEPEAFQSNMAMKMRASAAYEVAVAKLDQALMDLRLLISEEEWECVEKAQEHWESYRTALEDCALREYLGGTHAPLAMSLVGLAETERRADEIQAQIKERAER